ncbi:hypothetical protein ACI65C_006477 [Semiaphis heraclei]
MAANPSRFCLHLECPFRLYLFRANTTSHGSETCPNCRANVPRFSLLQLFPTEDDRFCVKTKEELESLQKKLNGVKACNEEYKNKMNDVTLKLNAAKKNLNKSNKDYDDINTKYLNHRNNCVNIIAKSDKKELISEIENIKLEKEYFQKKCCDLKPSRTSSKIITRSISTLPRQIQSPPQPSQDGFLSNCHFLIVNELKKVSGATNHLHFNEQRVLEHGGTVAYHYTNMVTHVIGISQKNSDVLRGLKECKKCATDYWLSDVISERKMVKPWLPHHFPIPYSENNLPLENNKIAIVNFDKNEYIKIKVMAESVGATVINKISCSTDIVITSKLEGEMIKKALALKLPVVNAQWINDILFDKKIGLKNFKLKKYQQFDSHNLYSMNYNMVSHVMEAWEKHSDVPKLQFSTNKVGNNSTLANNKRKTCVIQELSESSINNDNSNNAVIPVATTSNEAEPREEKQKTVVDKEHKSTFYVTLWQITRK